MQQNEQINFWQGQFGKEYTKRNTLSMEDLDSLCLRQWGITRSTVNELFLGSLKKDIRILETGCNVGQQLRHLQLLGFKNLFGIEIQKDAMEQANSIVGVKAVLGSILEIPYENNSFDLVYTSGVLIHIHPDNLKTALREIYRCSKQYIWGVEYFSRKEEEVVYRGHQGFLWKRDFCGLFQELFPDLKLIKELRVKYLDNDNIDQMYLLEKSL